LNKSLQKELKNVNNSKLFDEDLNPNVRTLDIKERELLLFYEAVGEDINLTQMKLVKTDKCEGYQNE
jgi:hypothetical protein